MHLFIYLLWLKDQILNICGANVCLCVSLQMDTCQYKRGWQFPRYQPGPLCDLLDYDKLCSYCAICEIEIEHRDDCKGFANVQGPL